jgi:glycosyltransferase involved in cell wall biosynthesis
VKILHYASSLSRTAGGLYYSVSGLCRGLAELGVDISVCGGADQNFADDRKIWDGLRVYPHRLHTRYGFAPEVFWTIKNLKPDVVHIHGIWSAASIYGRYASHLGARVVVSPRGMLDPWILSRRSSVKTLHAALFERPLLERAYLHALNASELESALRFSPSLAARSFVVPNGIPEFEIDQGSGKVDEFLYIGRLHEKKQVLELIRAWKQAAPDRRYKLTIAGWGDGSYEQQLKSEVGESEQISFVGPLYGDEKLAALRRARFFVLPSLSEGLPMAVLEAIQYGCIPIITDECNLPQMFSDGIAMRMATDFGDFGQVLGAAISQSETELESRALASKTYARRFVWPEIARLMLEKYRSMAVA